MCERAFLVQLANHFFIICPNTRLPTRVVPADGFNPSEKYQSVGMIIIWTNKKCSKPPTTCCDITVNRQFRVNCLNHSRVANWVVRENARPRGPSPNPMVSHHVQNFKHPSIISSWLLCIIYRQIEHHIYIYIYTYIYNIYIIHYN